MGAALGEVDQCLRPAPVAAIKMAKERSADLIDWQRRAWRLLATGSIGSCTTPSTGTRFDENTAMGHRKTAGA